MREAERIAPELLELSEEQIAQLPEAEVQRLLLRAVAELREARAELARRARARRRGGDAG